MLKKIYKNAKLVVSTVAEHLSVAQTRNMQVTMITEPDAGGRGAELILREKEYSPRPDRQWANRGKTLHLTLKSNESHIQVIGYIRREEVKNNRQLGDILCMEAEQLSSALEDMESLASESTPSLASESAQ